MISQGCWWSRVSDLLWTVRNSYVPIHLCCVSVPFSAVSCASRSSSTIPTLKRGYCMGVGFVHIWTRVWTEYHLLPRPDSIPMSWSAVCVWGSVHSEERGSRVRVPAGVLRYLRSRVRQRQCHLRQCVRAGIHGLCPQEGNPGGPQRTLWSVVGKRVGSGRGFWSTW